MARNRKGLLLILLVLIVSGFCLSDTLTTVDRKVYQGKLIDYKFGYIRFNVYRFGKFYRSQRFPLAQIWKIEFNEPVRAGMQSMFEMEPNLSKLRRGKRKKTVTLNGNQSWIDTGISLRIGQSVLFSITGSIHINENTQVFQDGEQDLVLNYSKAMPNQPTGAVIAKFGRRGAPFYVGNDKAPFKVDKKANLYIGVNDFNYGDNSGKFTIIIYY